MIKNLRANTDGGIREGICVRCQKSRGKKLREKKREGEFDSLRFILLIPNLR